MEVQLQELIGKIKDEGINAAKAEADRIKAEAEAEAKKIISDAESKSKSAMEAVKKEEAMALERQHEALVQASRDLLLNVSNKITAIFDAALGKGVSDVAEKDLETLIKNVLSSLDSSKGYELVLSEQDAKKFGAALKDKFSQLVKGGVEVKPSRSVNAGFRIGEKDGSVFYDITTEAIVENLGAYLNPKLAEEFKKAAGIN
jgi:V/A-type H+-transporting ATPase subunit E